MVRGPYLERELLLHDKLQSILLVVSAVGSKNILLNQLQERLDFNSKVSKSRAKTISPKSILSILAICEESAIQFLSSMICIFTIQTLSSAQVILCNFQPEWHGQEICVDFSAQVMETKEAGMIGGKLPP